MNFHSSGALIYLKLTQTHTQIVDKVLLHWVSVEYTDAFHIRTLEVKMCTHLKITFVYASFVKLYTVAILWFPFGDMRKDNNNNH